MVEPRVTVWSVTIAVGNRGTTDGDRGVFGAAADATASTSSGQPEAVGAWS